MMESIFVICVDEKDQPIQNCEKLLAHQDGVLHRAVSVYLTSENSNVLLQKRSRQKYHSPGLWSNAACTHPLEGETPEAAARRALQTELGVFVKSLEYQGYFIYKTSVGDDLIEHELDHVFVGTLSENHPIPFSAEEVEDVRWASPENVMEEVSHAPETLTHWFPFLIQYLRKPVSGMDFRGQ